MNKNSPNNKSNNNHIDLTSLAIGSIIYFGGIFGLALWDYYRTDVPNEKFNTIPEVRRLDSVYKSQTKMYNIKLDSLKKIHLNK